jgi:hypothetical protein
MSGQRSKSVNAVHGDSDEQSGQSAASAGETWNSRSGTGGDEGEPPALQVVSGEGLKRFNRDLKIR